MGRRWMDLFFIRSSIGSKRNGAQRRALMKQRGGESGYAEAFSRAINAALNRAEENAPAKRPPDLIGFDTAN